MSTEIAEIKGEYHTVNKDNAYSHNWNEGYIDVTRFYGGKDRGAMIQLTMRTNKDGYIMMSKKQCEELARVLNECFDYDKYPSE